MRNFLRYILFLLISIFRSKHRYIILNPNLTLIKINQVIIFDKEKKCFLTYNIRNNYDYITVLEIYFYQSYEVKNMKFIDEKLSQFDKKNILIVDCGSNIGCSTNYFLENYKNSKVVSIEPDKENFKMLVKNIKDRNRAELINSAISNDIKSFEVRNDLKNFKDNRGKNIVEITEINSSKSLKVNDIIQDKKNSNFEPFIIKIDIEGYEKKLFESNTEWVDQFEIIIIELHDWMLPGQSTSQNFFKTITASMNKNKRDIIIKGENLISIKH